MQKTPCYVTGIPTTHQTFYGGQVYLKVSQDAFAHFIIRAGKDPSHRAIVERVTALADEYEHYQDEHLAGQRGFMDDQGNITSIEGLDNDSYIALALQIGHYKAQIATLMQEKAVSGIRILRQMREDYQKTGKLSS